MDLIHTVNGETIREEACPSHADIAVRAYEIWKHEFGDIDTSQEVEVEIWLRAERELEHHFGRHHGEA